MQQENRQMEEGAAREGRGERSAGLYRSDDLERIERVLHQPNFAPERRPFSMWKLLGIFFGVVGSLSLLAWVGANLLL